MNIFKENDISTSNAFKRIVFSGYIVRLEQACCHRLRNRMEPQNFTNNNLLEKCRDVHFCTCSRCRQCDRHENCARPRASGASRSRPRGVR